MAYLMVSQAMGMLEIVQKADVQLEEKADQDKVSVLIYQERD